MNKQTFPLSWLTVVIVSILLIAACTAKLQGHSNETDNATATSTTKADEPIDTTLTLEKLRWKNSPYSVEENEYRLDTSITNHLPHFNALELLTYYPFLFDLGEDDSMYCERCNDTIYLKYKGSKHYRYEYYYKGARVQASYISVQTFYNSPKIDRIHIAFKRLKNIDVTPTKTPEELAPKATLELDMWQQYYEHKDDPYVTPRKPRHHSVKELLQGYRGLVLSKEGKLGHAFMLEEWYIVAYENGTVQCSPTFDD